MLGYKIPTLSWEGPAASAAGLTLDQFRFTISLFAAVPVCYGFVNLKSPLSRHIYGLLSGVALIFYPFGAEVLQILPPATITYFAMAYVPKHCGKIAWLVNFSYLISLHVAQASGTSWNEGKMDFTGGLMILVLKLIAMAVARQDSTRKPEHLNPYQQSHQLKVLPSPLEALSYTVSMGSLLSGPFFEFSEYKEFIDLQGVWSPSAARRMPSTGRRLSRAGVLVLKALFHFAVFVTLGQWNGAVMLSDWYHALPLWHKYGVMVLTGATYQFKYFAAWKLAEAGYVIAGFDFEGYDEKKENGRAVWGRCRNASFLGVWTADSARTVPQNWNVCTGKWLRRYVYERVTPRNRKPGFQHLLFTQFVCGLWHGLFAGYQLFFFGTAMWIYMSQVLFRAETHLNPKWIAFLPYRVVKVLWTNIVLNYMAAAFQLLLWKDSVSAYLEVYCLPHLVLLAFCVFGGFVKAKRPAAPTVTATAAAAASVSSSGEAKKAK